MQSQATDFECSSWFVLKEKGGELLLKLWILSYLLPFLEVFSMFLRRHWWASLSAVPVSGVNATGWTLVTPLP